MPPTLKPVIAEEFCKHVQWAYEIWQTATTLLTQEAVEATRKTHSEYLWYRLHVMMKEAFLLEIAKFHDPATHGEHGRTNLTLNYIIDFGGFDLATAQRLIDLRDKLDAFNRGLDNVRNRILAHKDLRTILEQRNLGGFPAGADTDYFENLKQFAYIAHEAVTGFPWAWSEDGKIDAEVFLERLAESKVIHPIKPPSP